MKKIRKMAALLLICLMPMLLMPAFAFGEGSQAIPDGPATVTAKDEVVYARLSGSGEAQNVYIVNHFTLEAGGSFSDYGSYTSVTNLTDLTPLTRTEESVDIQTASQNFYYQGTPASNDLPWNYTIEYTLDGAPVTPQALAGQSGKLEMRVTSARNEHINEAFYNQYMQQITITLDTDKCQQIAADGATLANVGKSRVLVFTVLPQSDAAITVTAEVSDFEMAGIDIAATPFSMGGMFDFSGLLASFAQLTEAMASLSNGIGALESGAAEAASGAETLKEGASGFGNGLAQLGENSASLTDASAQVQSGLSQLVIASTMLNVNKQVADGLSELSARYVEFHNGLLAYAEGLATLTDNYTSLSSGMTGISDGVAELHGGIAELSGGASQLTAETAAIPGRIADELSGVMGSTGAEAVSFMSEKNGAVTFVQFVFTTEKIAKTQAESTAPLPAAELTFWERLTRLFGA